MTKMSERERPKVSGYLDDGTFVGSGESKVGIDASQALYEQARYVRDLLPMLNPDIRHFTMDGGNGIRVEMCFMAEPQRCGECNCRKATR